MSENSPTSDHILVTENSAGQFSWRGLVPPRIEEVAMRGNAAMPVILFN
jgi:hypothetical protein